VSYELPDLAAGYFIGNIVASLTACLGYEDGAVIFPVEGTKETKKRFYIKRDETNVHSF
jgi:energy-converting hydrogenase Eha subunit B